MDYQNVITRSLSRVSNKIRLDLFFVNDFSFLDYLVK